MSIFDCNARFLDESEPNRAVTSSNEPSVQTSGNVYGVGFVFLLRDEKNGDFRTVSGVALREEEGLLDGILFDVIIEAVEIEASGVDMLRDFEGIKRDLFFVVFVGSFVVWFAWCLRGELDLSMVWR